ncbi:hypothetical protein GF371_02340 [Candidatus Woesearchaeota archaeon]|nr:hypothetical protein [Candidatus Woesearchaeota archaeon]
MNKTKNTTIRTGSEIGKYKQGKIYDACSYAGRDWGIKIKIIKVIRTKAGKLKDYGLSERNIRAAKVSQDSIVELIKFKIEKRKNQAVRFI